MTLAFQYEARRAHLTTLVPDGGPETYDLCADHADRTQPPVGWTLRDDRPDDPGLATPPPAELGSPQTVAVLAAALRGTPDDGVPGDVRVDVSALDAIVDAAEVDPDDPGLDLFGAPDDSDGPTGDEADAADALSELTALSQPSLPDADPDGHVRAWTVPGAHRDA